MNLIYGERSAKYRAGYGYGYHLGQTNAWEWGVDVFRVLELGINTHGSYEGTTVFINERGRSSLYINI